MKKSILLAFILIGLIHVNASDLIRNIYLNTTNTTSETILVNAPIYLVVESSINLDNAEVSVQQNQNNEINIDLRYSKASYRQDFKDYRLGSLEKGDYKLTFTLAQKGSDIIDTTIVLNFKVEDLPSMLLEETRNWAVMDASGTIYQHTWAYASLEADGKTYQIESFWDPMVNGPQQFYAYREEDGKLYEYSIKDKNERLVFDTNLKTGDKLVLAEGFSVVVEALSDTAVIYGLEHEFDEEADTAYLNCRRWHLRGVENPEYTDTWVEHIGSMKHGLHFFDPEKETRLMYSWSTHPDYLTFTNTFNLGKYWSFGLQMGKKNPDQFSTAKTALQYENKNGTLHIKGVLKNDTGPCHVLMTIENESTIRLSTWDLPPFADGYYEYFVDFTLPGVFTKDSYQISLDGQSVQKADGPLALPHLSDEKAAEIWYDLRGRRVAAPESESLPEGIYISKDKKVLILHR